MDTKAAREAIQVLRTPCPDDCDGFECMHSVRREYAAYELAGLAPQILDENDSLRAEVERLRDLVAHHKHQEKEWRDEPPTRATHPRQPMSGRCRHDRAIWIPLGEPSDWSKRAMECQDCGEWLPLGHSDETPERVAVEIRAAELAFNGGPIRTCDNSMPEDCEGCGWDCWPWVDAMHDAAPAQWAGYLARAIVEHDDKETP